MEQQSREQLLRERPLFVVVVLVKKLTSKKQPLIAVVVLAELSLAIPFPSLLLSEEQERLKVRRRLLLSKKIPVVFPVASGLTQLSMEQLSMEQLPMERLSREQLSREQLLMEQLLMEQLLMEQLLMEQLSREPLSLALLLSSER